MSLRDHHGDDSFLAAEYALGLLDARDRREAERRVAADPGFADEVAFWQARLTPLIETVAPVEPPASLWDRIDAALGAETTSQAKPPVAPKASGLWESLAFWRGLAFGSLGLAAASLVGLAVLLPRPMQNPPLVAALAPSGGPPAFVAAYDPARRTVIVIPASLAGADRRVPELWLIPPGGSPRSLGLLDPARPVTLSLPEELRAEASPQAVLAVSLEPPGGSPTGQPTGPVIAQGRLTSL